MKPKSALFLSAALTTFVLAVLASLLSAFNSAKTVTTADVATPTQEVVMAAVLPTQAIPTAAQPTQPTQVGPEQAASIAAQYMKKGDVYSVESSTIKGANAYKVTFSSGDIVFVGLDGSIITTTKLPPVTVNVVPTAAPSRHHGGHGGAQGGSSSGGGGGGEPEGGDN